MKLPDFRVFHPLNDLKRRMGIPEDVLGTLSLVINPGRLTPIELEKLISADGLDIESLEDIKVLDDGTLAYKDRRILLYIRDVTVYRNQPPEPRFHLVNCRTLQDMRARNRLNRYVVAARPNGQFKVNVIDGARSTMQELKLSVCQNCLDFLALDGFTMQLSGSRRRHLVDAFSIPNFFERFPQSLHQYQPEHTDESAPLNDYAVGFWRISHQVRQAANWRCQGCGLSLSHPGHRRFLHAHHRNGQKWNNAAENLKVVCMGCHANEPSHAHMKSLSMYQEFLKVRRALGR